MFLYETVTPKEIEEMYNLPEGSVRRDLKRKKFRLSEIRKSGATWLIAKREAKRVYKGELTMIFVWNDWDWISKHVDEELEHNALSDTVTAWANKHGIDLDRVKELYQDAVESGEENGRYLSFSPWFYEYKESHEEWS